MAQQLNLFDARFAPQSQRYTARQGLLGVLVVLGLAAAGAQAVRWSARSLEQQTQALEVTLKPMRQQMQASASPAAGQAQADVEAELAQLRTLETSQRRIRAALDAGVAGSREGHAEFLAALARQASGQVWITGFQVSEGAATLGLEGRMLEPGALTEYLRRLNNEPRFRGRPFAQLSLLTGESRDGVPAVTEFALRAGAATSETP